MEPPNWFWLRKGVGMLDWLLNQSLAAKALLRLYQMPSPWNWLVPEGVEKAVSVAPPKEAALPFDDTRVIWRTCPRRSLLGV